MKSWCYFCCRSFTRAFLRLFVRLEVWRGPGVKEPNGAAVVVANHISHFDPLFLSLSFERKIDWMTSEEFYAHTLAATWLRAVDTFPVDRSRPDRRALRTGVERLRAGHVIGVFPEGGIRAGITSILEGAAPKSGATALARLTGAPILPCVILGTDRLYARRRWWPFPSRTRVWIALGAPFSVAGMNGEQAKARMADSLRRLYAKAITHFSLDFDDLPATPQRRKGRDKHCPA
jgi:1-acyl-sn-glycerol-3-phosphate acyltransferase